MTIQKLNRQKGFALLLTLVVVSVIGVVAFGVGRLTLTEFRQTLRFQDSQDALQTAEAGVEDGLVRFRFNRNAEVPLVLDQSVAKDCGSVPEATQTTPLVLRVNLDGDTNVLANKPRLQCVDPHTAAVPDPTDHVYDLKMYYKADSLGHVGDGTLNGTNSVPLQKDDKLVISGVDGSTQLRLQAQTQPGSSGTGPYLLVEYSGLDSLSPKIYYNDGRNYYEMAQLNKGNAYIDLSGGTTSITIKPLGGDEFIAASLRGTTSNSIDYGITYIQSTGYFNGVKRTLVSILNRTAGSTKGLYDFVLFSGTSDLNAQN